MNGKTKYVLGSLVGAAVIQAAFLLGCPPGTRHADAAVDAGAGGSTASGVLDVANEDCSQTSGMVAAGAGITGTYTYAQHAYPGMTAAQLSQVRTIGHLSADTAVFSNLSESPFPNYPFVTSESLASFGAKVLVTDGMVAVQCGSTSTTMSTGSGPATSSTRWFDSVTFTLVK